MVGTLVASELDDLRFAMGLYRDNNLTMAKNVLKEFIRNYPQSDYLCDAQYMLAMINLQQRNYRESDDGFAYLLRHCTQPRIRADILLGYGQTRFFSNDLPTAQKHLNSFVSEFSKHREIWKAYYYLGRISYEKKEYEQARTYYEEAWDRSDDMMIRLAQLDLFLATDEWEQAYDIVNEFLELSSGNEQRNLAIVKFHTYNIEQNRYHDVINIAFEEIPSTSRYYEEYSLLVGIAFYENESYVYALSKLEDVSSDKGKYYRGLCHISLDNPTEAKAILQDLYDTTDNEELRTNSFFYLAKLDPLPENTISKLKSFISDNPEHPFVGAAYYQIAALEFRQENYKEMLQNLDKAAEFDLDEETEEKAAYLRAEALFNLDRIDDALSQFENYTSTYPEGVFSDEAVFKKGVIKFQHENYNESFKHFIKITEEYPVSDKIGMSNFYLGEISFIQEKYELARRYYERALLGKVDKGVVWQKIAHCRYREGDYQRALSALTNIPDESRYLFDKYFLRANIMFATNDYAAALQAANQAEDHARNSEDREAILANKARILYQLKRFDEAENIYRRLTITTTSPEAYIIKGALAAFSAENYQKAIEQFTTYLENFPDGAEYLSAMIGLGDSYYNLGQYKNAIQQYDRVIRRTTNRELVQNVLNGLQWAVEQSSDIDFRDKLESLMESDIADLNKRMILERKLEYEFDREMWDAAVASANKYENSFPRSERLHDIRFMKARALSYAGRYDEAENLFMRLHNQNPSPYLSYEWGMANLRRGERLQAYHMIRNAALAVRDIEIWLKLLEISAELNVGTYQNDHARFLEFASQSEKEEAEVIWVRWNIERGEYERIDQTLEELVKSESKLIRAKAQFLKGLSLYERNNYEQAIPELLRVRYLYPDISDIRIEAEYYACLAYLETDQKEEARNLFDLIKQELPPEKRNDLQERM
jgi:TolA-binding protein